MCMPCMHIYLLVQALSAGFFMSIGFYLIAFCEDFKSVCKNNQFCYKKKVLEIVTYNEFIAG